MTSLTPTVRVERLPHYNALKMTWDSPVNKGEIALLAQKLIQALEQMKQPAYVLVTLRGEAQYPFALAVSETLRDACQHPMLAEVLICGDAAAAGTISRRLTLLLGQCVARNFSTEYEALRYLTAQQPVAYFSL